MRRNKIPAPLPFIFNLTSDFCGGRRRTIALRFPPPKQNLPSLTAPSHQWLTVSNYYVNRGGRSLSSFLSPDWTQASYYQRVHGSVFVWPVTSSGFLHPAKRRRRGRLNRQSRGRRSQKWNSANVTSVLVCAPLRRSALSLKGQRRNEQKL